MRLILFLTLLFTTFDTSAQVFNEELYSKYNSESNGMDFGKLIGIDDTLAILDFYESGYPNAQIVTEYQYSE